ncbi:MAG: hypothetical protein U0892_06905 [Pirellulales bacterium]
MQEPRTRVLDGFKARFDIQPGDLVLILADSWEVTQRSLRTATSISVRNWVFSDPEDAFSWVVEFPMFDSRPGRKSLSPCTICSLPRKQDLEMLKSNLAACRAQAYDLVINGYEARRFHSDDDSDEQQIA